MKHYSKVLAVLFLVAGLVGSNAYGQRTDPDSKAALARIHATMANHAKVTETDNHELALENIRLEFDIARLQKKRHECSQVIIERHNLAFPSDPWRNLEDADLSGGKPDARRRALAEACADNGGAFLPRSL
jgi:hypothetical protein